MNFLKVIVIQIRLYNMCMCLHMYTDPGSYKLTKRTIHARCTHAKRTLYERYTNAARTIYARCTIYHKRNAIPFTIRYTFKWDGHSSWMVNRVVLRIVSYRASFRIAYRTACIVPFIVSYNVQYSVYRLVEECYTIEFDWLYIHEV